jgi:hypothetical protein
MLRQRYAPSANTSYSATPSNSTGAGSTISTTLNINTGSVGNGGGGTNFCVGSDSIINVSWPQGGQVRPTTNGFGNQRLAFRITVPSSFSPALNVNHLALLTWSKYRARTSFREFTVSKIPVISSPANICMTAPGPQAPRRE